MGSHVLIISFVIVVIGGIGSVWGALVAALVIGFADTFGKVLVPELRDGRLSGHGRGAAVAARRHLQERLRR
jgi:branched-subunit amino acid ABC-type transport system permease component